MSGHGGAGARWPSLHSRRRERRVPPEIAAQRSVSAYAEAPGFRHFIRWPDPDERYAIKGKPFDPSDQGQFDRAADLMLKLADMVEASPFAGITPGDPSSQFNPRLPSGFTYFLQFIAHDMVHSSLALSRSEGHTAGFANLRRMPLRLETMYGGGPARCPIAFERAPDGRPRTRMRLGAARDDKAGRQRDIARGRSATIPADCGYPEAFVADPRNDMHPIVSQLTMLFHHLHNAIAERLEQDPHVSKFADGVARSQLIFLMTQCACVLIFRNLIREDLLPRVLHPDVRLAYARGGGALLDEDNGVSRGDWSAPLEFTHGVLRFGHAMVRSIYAFNPDNKNHQIKLALRFNSEMQPKEMPLPNPWTVDWPLFFGSQPDTNFSRRIGAWTTYSLEKEISDELPADGGTLVFRDFMSGSVARPWSLRALLREIRKRRPDLLVNSPLLFDGVEGPGWLAPLRDWFSVAATNAKNQPTPADIEELAADPPIPFFTRFEAGGAPGAMGDHLGVFGSILMADVVYSIFKQDDLLGVDPFAELPVQLQQLTRALLEIDADCLMFLAEQRSVTALIDFLGDRISFPA